MSEHCLNCLAMERERDHARGELGRARFRADNDLAALRAALNQEQERSRQLGMRAMHADRCPVRGGPVLNATVTGMPIECMCGLSALLSGRGEGGNDA